MARILLLVVLIMSVYAAHEYQPRFLRASEDDNSTQYNKVGCTEELNRLRNIMIEDSKCGEPKEVFEYLEPQAAHLHITPMAVWVKRCNGLCDNDTYGSKCRPTLNVTWNIPVRIYDERTNKEFCTSYAIEEHLSCGCCADAPKECAAPRVYDPRKCGCQCPDKTEKQTCQSQLNQTMSWNPVTCVCEEKALKNATSSGVAEGLTF